MIFMNLEMPALKILQLLTDENPLIQVPLPIIISDHPICSSNSSERLTIPQQDLDTSGEDESIQGSRSSSNQRTGNALRHSRCGGYRAALLAIPVIYVDLDETPSGPVCLLNKGARFANPSSLQSGSFR